MRTIFIHIFPDVISTTSFEHHERQMLYKIWLWGEFPRNDYSCPSNHGLNLNIPVPPSFYSDRRLQNDAFAPADHHQGSWNIRFHLLAGLSIHTSDYHEQTLVPNSKASGTPFTSIWFYKLVHPLKGGKAWNTNIQKASPLVFHGFFVYSYFKHFFCRHIYKQALLYPRLTQQRWFCGANRRWPCTYWG